MRVDTALMTSTLGAAGSHGFIRPEQKSASNDTASALEGAVPASVELRIANSHLDTWGVEE